MGPRFRFTVITLISVCLGACAAGAGGPVTSPAEVAAPTGAASTAPTSAPAFPLRLTDDAGRDVEIAERPQRIVSLAPSNTEMVCALGACERLVGVTDFDDYPPEVAEVPDVVIGAQVDVERIVDADPDLILAGANEFTPSATIEQLTGLGYPVVALYAETLEAVYADLELVGRAIGAAGEAGALVDGMRERADEVVAAVDGAVRPRTFYEVSVFEGQIYTAGEGSFLASLIELAGGDPVTGDAQTFAIELEALVAADPELILLGDASYDPSISPQSVAARPGWGAITAVREGRIVPITDDVLITRPGPRIVDGLEVLARAIHPERFD